MEVVTLLMKRCQAMTKAIDCALVYIDVVLSRRYHFSDMLEVIIVCTHGLLGVYDVRK